MNLLIFKLSPIGDTVMFLPVLQALRAAKPAWVVTVITTPASAELYADILPPDRVLVAETEAFRKLWKKPGSLLRWLRRLRRLRPDAALLSFDQSSVARLLAQAAGARLRVGGAASAVRWQFGLTQEIPWQPGQSLAEWEWEMARVLAREAEIDWAERPPPPRLGPSGPPLTGREGIIVHAGSSREYMRWPVGQFAQLAETLATTHRVHWIDRPETSAIELSPAISRISPASLADFLRLASTVQLFVGNHSGAFHLATAAGCRAVVLAGSTQFAADPPWFRERWQVLRAPGLACLPCDHLTVAVNACRNQAEPMACMKYWRTESVEGACRAALAQP